MLRDSQADPQCGYGVGDQMRIRTKQAAIVEAARQMFMEQGFAGASMEAIAGGAGVSKATLYAYFRSKEDLFGHVVASRRSAPAVALGAPASVPLERRLVRIASELSALILSAETTSMYRIIMSEARAVPDLGARFYAEGPAKLLVELGDFLHGAMQRGELVRADPAAAATQFIALILGDLQMRRLLAVGDVPSARLRSKVARQGVTTFLRAYRG
jgi:TetR/AcrR family transcriptional repressor of mexJK operon